MGSFVCTFCDHDPAEKGYCRHLLADIDRTFSTIHGGDALKKAEGEIAELIKKAFCSLNGKQKEFRESKIQELFEEWKKSDCAEDERELDYGLFLNLIIHLLKYCDGEEPQWNSEGEDDEDLDDVAFGTSAETVLYSKSPAKSIKAAIKLVKDWLNRAGTE